jgi:hypothetical protein
MTYKFVFTAEKSGSDVLAVLETCPGWLDVVACFPPDSPFAQFTQKISEDGSYAEWEVFFLDREIYELWYEAYNDLHDVSRETALTFFESQGGIIGLYTEGVDLSSPERSRPIEEFVSRFPTTE